MISENNSDKHQNSKTNTLLSAVDDYVTVKPVDTPRTIYLVEKAKGDRDYRKFSAEIGRSTSLLSCVLNGYTIKIRPNTIERIANAAAARSGVTLDSLMDAQGLVHKKYLASFTADYRSNIRRILIDVFLEAGYKIEYAEKYHPEKDPVNGTVMLQLRKNDTDEIISCDFKIRTRPIVKAQEHINALLTFWVNETVKANFFQKNRLFLVVDNSVVYEKLLKKVAKLRITKDISLLLVDPQRRMVISEKAIARSDEEQVLPMFPPYDTEPNWIKCYPFREIRVREAMTLISDKMMSKGWLIWLIDSGKLQSEDIHTDFKIAVKTPRRKQVFNWAFTLMLLPEDADEASAREEIRAWISKAIVYCHLGGKLDRLSLIVDNETIYNYAFEEISTLHLNNDLTVICISSLRGLITHEYRIPLDGELILKEKFALI